MITRGVAVALAIASALIALPGCGGTSQEAARWTRTDLRPVSQPVGVDGRFIVIVRVAHGLRVMALDARSGATVWSDAVSPSAIAPGEPPLLAVVGNDVIYPSAVNGRVAELLGANARTGLAVWQGPLAVLTSWPSLCPGTSTAVCLTGVTPAHPNTVDSLSYDGATGRVLGTVPVSSRGTFGREIVTGLFDPGARHPELLTAATGTAIGWTRPLTQIFTLRGASTDWGWQIDRVGDVGLFVGTVGTKPLMISRKGAVLDLSQAMTAGFRITNGAVAWRAAGFYYCGLLPCARVSQSSSSSSPAAAANVAVVVLLRGHGRESSRGTTPALPRLSPGAAGTLLGMAPANGRTLWSFSLHRALASVLAAREPETGAETIVLPGERGRLIDLDLRTGTEHAIGANASAWCGALTTYKEPMPYHGSRGLSTSTYLGQSSLSPCTAAGRPRSAPRLAPPFVGALGGEVARTIAWSEPRAVVTIPAAR